VAVIARNPRWELRHFPDRVGQVRMPGSLLKSTGGSFLASAEVYSGVGFQNYVWFQQKLGRIANLLVSGRTFAAVIVKLQAEFPAATQRQETLDQIMTRLDRIHPGARNMLGSLGGPATLARLTVRLPERGRRGECNTGRHCSSQRLRPSARGDTTSRRWLDNCVRRLGGFDLKPGEALKLADGSCVVAGSEPALGCTSDLGDGITRQPGRSDAPRSPQSVR
jgi:hypothetical protein